MLVRDKQPKDGLMVGESGQTELWAQRWARVTGNIPIILKKESNNRHYGAAKRLFIHSVVRDAKK